MAKQLKRYDLVSPREGNAHDSPAPRHSEEDLCEVIEVRRQVELGEWPSDFLANEGGGDDVPDLLKARRALRLSARRPTTAALVVTMDDPDSLGVELAKELMSRGVKFKEDRGHVQFCDETYSFSALKADLAMANHKALNHAFDVKYHYDAKRPEQYAKVDPCVFCVNEAGAPNHYSYPAGHGATSGSAQAVIEKYFDLDDEMKLKVHDACYQFAHWRTLLGVHFREDNDEGIRIGRKYSS